MRGQGADEFYPAHMFSMEELKELFEENGITPVKGVGKTVFITDRECLKEERIFRNHLELEINYASLPSVAGSGTHIALIGRKN